MATPPEGRVVVALGGNALLRRGEPLTLEVQNANIARAVVEISRLARSSEVVVTHGNGPQVGLLALQAEAFSEVPAYPLDVLGAESEGMIGYLLEQQLRNALPDREVAVVLTQVVVDAQDPSLARPTKPIGPVLDEEEAHRARVSRGLELVKVGPDAWRRVVPSPLPVRILEIEAIRLLVDAGQLVVCAGGGGIPVVERCVDGRRELRGVPGVIDKDRCAARLAEEIGARRLLLLTDVDHVYRDWPETARPFRRATVEELRRLDLDEGSMGPKVEAACDFVERTGGRAFIGGLDRAAELMGGDVGTAVVP